MKVLLRVSGKGIVFIFPRVCARVSYKSVCIIQAVKTTTFRKRSSWRSGDTGARTEALNTKRHQYPNETVSSSPAVLKIQKASGL